MSPLIFGRHVSDRHRKDGGEGGRVGELSVHWAAPKFRYNPVDASAVFTSTAAATSLLCVL